MSLIKTMEDKLEGLPSSDFSRIQADVTTSPSQLNEFSTCPDFTFSNSLRTPDGPLRGRSVKEFEDQLRYLQKDNFNLKLRIYFLEERMGANFNFNKDNILKQNVELMVEIESLKKELQEKHELLCQAVKAMDLEEDEFKKTAQAKNDEILTLKQEIEELKLQLQDVRYENDNESSHKSYHSEPIFFSSQLVSLPESNSRIRMFQEKIACLEKELTQEKENNASLQMVLDQADTIHNEYEKLKLDSEKKEQTIVNLNEDLKKTKDMVNDLTIQIKNLQKDNEQFKIESEKLSNLLVEKSKAVEFSEEKITDFKRQYDYLKADFEKERQKSDRNKYLSKMKVTEMEEELEKQRNRVQDLQKKLGSAHQELKENQNLLVPKSPKCRSTAINTDCDNVSVPNSTTSLGVPKEDALRDALRSTSPSKSPVLPKTFDFNAIYKILNTVMFSTKPQLMKQLMLLKDVLVKSEAKIVHLKAQEIKACAIIKNLMQQRKNSEGTCTAYKHRIAELERELEGVVSKPEEKEISNSEHEKSQNNWEETEYKALIIELENKIKVLELTLKEKDIHVEYIEAQNQELLNNIQSREKEMINLERSISTQGESMENVKEIAEQMYSKLFDEKNKEIEKLNEELRRRTHDLQAVVNNELWQKNREIEKLRIKYSQLLENKEKEMTELKESFSALSKSLEELRVENDEKHVENSNLKIDISDLKLQLQLLRDKIGEIGLISDDKLEVEIIISSLDDMKNIQKQLEDVRKEKEILTTKINELENAVQITGDWTIDPAQESELMKLREHLKMSEVLRNQTNQACHILRSQLEELAVFLDSLMKQKSVLGFLGGTQNKKLREAIDHSLDLSKSLNMSLGVNPEQSLLQLSNITALLNCSDLSNLTTNEDSNRYSFSILPEQATLTYQSHTFKVAEENAEQTESFRLKSMQDQIDMLQRELRMKNQELIRYRRESKTSKDLKLSHSKPRISPSKLKNAVTMRDDKFDSESETWSEPDVNVSKARIGLFKDDDVSITGIEEIHSSDSTDESLTDLNKRKSDILNECQLTITRLNKQIQDLQTKLKEKEHSILELQEIHESNVSIKEENELLKVQIERVNLELTETKMRMTVIHDEKLEVERELELRKANICDLEKSNKELMEKYNLKDKEMNNRINQMKFERDQLVNIAKEYADMTEKSRQEIILIENKLKDLTVERENLEIQLKKEFEVQLADKLKSNEKEFMDKLRNLESRAKEELDTLHEKMSEMTQYYSKYYVKKSEVAMKIDETEALSLELKTLKQAVESYKKASELDSNNEENLKEEINNLREQVKREILKYSESDSEKNKLERDFTEIKNCKNELQAQLNDNLQEISSMKAQHQQEINLLQSYKSKLELKISELEFSNADLHNRLAKIQVNLGDHVYSSSLSLNASQIIDINKSVPVNHVTPYTRQISNASQSYVSEDEVRTRGPFSLVIPQKSVDSERIEANSSPDLGIESDQGRFSSLEVQGQLPRPLLQTLEITESMNNLLDGDNNSIQGSLCDNKLCYQKSTELTQENNSLKKNLLKTRKALEDTVRQLSLANQRKKQVEKNICRQIHKTSQVLREAKANLDSGSETDFLKK